MAMVAAMLAISVRVPSHSESLQTPSPCKCMCWEQSDGAAVGTGLTVMLSWDHAMGCALHTGQLAPCMTWC